MAQLKNGDFYVYKRGAAPNHVGARKLAYFNKSTYLYIAYGTICRGALWASADFYDINTGAKRRPYTLSFIIYRLKPTQLITHYDYNSLQRLKSQNITP